MEEKDTYLLFLDVWHQAVWIAFIGAVGAAVLIFIAYRIKYFSGKNFKEKFEIASKYEIARYLQANYALGLAIFFIANTAKPDVVELSPIWFFIRLFISLCLGTLHAYVAFLVFRYYYPGPLDKKLKKLRYSPRINPRTGNKMKLLSEDEEDVYLDEGMQAEEDAFSVDYDVWIDTQTGETHIEKYKGHLSALECDRCGFQTLRIEHEEILREPTAFESGEILKQYRCGYCGRVKKKTQTLSQKSDKEVVLDKVKHDRKKIEMIKVEIRSTGGGNKLYEFQSLNQARQFLQEFDYEKLE